MSDAVRFLVVTVAGVVLDIAIAYTLHTFAGVPLWLAAALGFVIAATANYCLHQTWSFQDGPRVLSATRAAKYGLVALATLLARAIAVAMLDTASGGSLPLLVLIGGAGVSFFVNFLLSKRFVFAEPADKESAS